MRRSSLRRAGHSQRKLERWQGDGKLCRVKREESSSRQIASVERANSRRSRINANRGSARLGGSNETIGRIYFGPWDSKGPRIEAIPRLAIARYRVSRRSPVIAATRLCFVFTVSRYAFSKWDLVTGRNNVITAHHITPLPLSIFRINVRY